MVPIRTAFDESIREQIRVNQARTPTERFEALCRLLDVARAMAPTTPEAADRRRRALAIHRRDAEQLREILRQLVAAERAAVATGV